MARSDRATFRLPAAALFVPVLLFVCITPLATVGGAWWVLYIVPVLALVWVVITHTSADAVRISTFGLLGSKAMTWHELDQLELPDARWAIAVGQDGRRLRLPMVRPRDVPRLVAVSGGSLRLGDPAGDIQANEIHANDTPADDIHANDAPPGNADGGAAPADNLPPADNTPGGAGSTGSKDDDVTDSAPLTRVNPRG